MKVALITDQHYGIRNDNTSVLDYQKRFLDEVFFPTLEQEQIDTVINLGDLVDRRKYINFNTANRMRIDFLDRLKDKSVYIIAGNHDVYYKDTNRINALSELLREYDNIRVFIDPTELVLDNITLLLLPWICKENQDQSYSLINSSKAQLCFGHLEIQGFEMHRGAFCDHGISMDTFNKFDMVCSGHFHLKSTYGNIHYLGAPYEMTWADYGSAKGFHILDLQTRDLQFVYNPYKMFSKVDYSDEGKDLEALMEYDFSTLTGSYVKVIVKSKNNPYWFDMFIERIEQHEPADLRVVEDHLNLQLEADENILNVAEDTATVLTSCIEGLGIREDQKKRLDLLLRSLYAEAASLAE